MNNYDLIAFDMDGTLLNSKKQIRKDSLDMIEKAVQAGKIVTLSTGRSLPELVQFREDFKNISYFNCISGALIYDNINKEIISSSPIPEVVAEKLLDKIKSEDLMIHFHSDKSVIQKDKLIMMPDYQMGVYQKMFEEITTRPENIFEYYEQTKCPLYKVCLYSKSPELREQLFPKLQDLELTLAYSEITSIECSKKGVSKAYGHKLLCEKLGIPLERTIAVGDADNDLEILKIVGLPVAMGNANNNVKDVAKVIVKSNDEGGCAQVIEEYLL